MKRTIDLDLDRLQSLRHWVAGFFRRRKQTLPYHKLALRKIETEIKSFRVALGKPSRRVSHEEYWRARALQLVAISVFACSIWFGLLAGLGALAQDVRLLVQWIAGALFTWFLPIAAGVIGIAVALGMGRLARSMLYPGADELLLLDKRSPIVLLRSFRDDTLHFEREKSDFMSRFLYRKRPTLFRRAKAIEALVTRYFFPNVRSAVEEPGRRVVKGRFEIVIHRQLEAFGPVLAIGQPGEKRPALAAARKYVSDAEWRQQVSEWLEQARLIVVIAGYTDGIQWELQQIALKGYASKTLVLLPPSRRRLPWRGFAVYLMTRMRLHDELKRRKRWRTICEAVAPQSVRPHLRRLRVDKIIGLYLAPNGSPVVMRSGAHTEANYRLALRVAAHGLFCHGWDDRMPTSQPIESSGAAIVAADAVG